MQGVAGIAPHLVVELRPERGHWIRHVSLLPPLQFASFCGAPLLLCDAAGRNVIGSFMRRVQSPTVFGRWLSSFLPGISAKAGANWLDPAPGAHINHIAKL